MLTSIKVFTGNTITAGQPVGITLNKVQGVLEKGVKYSLQFKVINYSSINTLNYIYVGTQKISNVDISQGTVIDTVDGKEVRLCSVEFTASSKVTNPVIKIGRNMVSSDTSNTLMYELTDFQLERGYKTNYSPNSNDLQIVKTDLESKINQLADSLQFYVAKNDFDNLGNTVSSALGQIEVSTGEISLKVEQTDIDNAKNELEGSIDKKISNAKAEIKMTTDSISQRVSSTESTTSTLTNKVTVVESTANTANSNATSALNKANSATTTANSASSNATSALNKANSAIEKADDAKDTADTAIETAEGANTTAGNALSTANTASQKVVAVEKEVTSTKSKVASIETNLDSITQRVSSNETTTSTLTTTIETVKTTANNANTNASNALDKANTASTNASNAVTTANKANTTASTASTNATTALNTANSAKDTASSASTKADGAVSTANTAKSTADKAQTTANSANTLANTANNTANTNKNNITTLQTTVTTTNNRVAELTTNLDGITQRVSSTESKLTTTTNKIDNLQIGGRNFVTNSNKFYAGGGATGITSSIGSDDVLTITATSGNGNWFTGWARCTHTLIENNFNEGDKVTISFTMKSSNSTKIPTIYFKQGMGYFSMAGNLSTQYSTVYCTTTWKKANGLAFHLGFQNAIGTYYIKDWKIEKGSKPTSWTPAPEDVDSSISNIDSKVQTTNNKVASIETNLNGITQRVSSTESTVSTHTTQLGTVDTRINNAKNSAISTASSDATTKANNALASAKTDATTKANNALADAKTYTNGQITTVNTTINNKVAEIKATTDAITQRVSSTETVTNEMKGTVNNLKSSHGLANAKDIIVYGDSDKYYPVYVKGGNQDLVRTIKIWRGFREQAPNDWHTSTHKGGLLFTWQGNFGGWGGSTYKELILENESTYTTLLADCGIRVYSQWYVFFLRGGGSGGALYHFASDQGLNLQVYYNGSSELIWSDGDYKVYADNYKTTVNKSRLNNLKIAKESSVTAVDAKVTTTNSKVATLETNLNGITQRVESTESSTSTLTQKVNATVKDVKVYYAINTSSTTAPTSGWSTTPPTWENGKYIWSKTTTTLTNGNSTTTNPVCITGAKGATGATGQTGAKGDKGDKGDTGATGASGKGVKSITNYYLATTSSSGVTTSTSGWTTTVQSVSSSKKYLWNYEKVTYTDNTSTSTTPCIIGAYGDTGSQGVKGDKGDTGATGATGKGIKSIVEYYAVSSSNTTAPTSWSTTVQNTTTTNKYLWNYEVITYTDNSTTSTPKKVIGTHGATGAKGDTGATGQKGDTGATGATGTGIQSVTTEYYLSTSKTTQTGGSWVTTQPTWSNGKYLWTRSKIVYKNPTSTAYTTPVCDSSWEAVNEVKPQIESNTSQITTTKNKVATIETNLSSITSRVSSTESSVSTIKGNVSSLQTRVNTAEQKITDSAIVSTVTNSQTYKNGLNGKVSTNQVISSINQTAEAIKISANKLDLTGELDLQGRFKCWKSNSDKTGNYLHMDGAMMYGYNKTGGSKPVFASGLWTDENMGYFSVGYTNALTTDANGCLWMSPQHGNTGCRLTFSRLVNSTMLTTNLYFQKDGAIDFSTNLRGANDTDDVYTYRFDSGVSTKSLRCDNLRTYRITPRSSGSYDIGRPTMRYRDIFADSMSTTNNQLRLGTVKSDGSWQTYGALDINSSTGYIFPHKGNGQLSLGTTGNRFHGIYLVNSPNVSSDERLKTDIHYLDEPMPEEPTILDGRVERNMKITTKDMYDFVKDDLKLASYRYNLNLERGNTATDYGFIAQDILYTKVGSELIQLEDKEDLNSTLSYNQGNYISTIVGALQEAINKIEVLEKKVQELESKLV